MALVGIHPGRIAAVDVYRGLVMLLLLPDLRGGFSFYRMAEQFPGDPLWQGLAHQFTHVPWVGATVWDLIMPSFVFLVGVSMPLSAMARRGGGEAGWEITLHAWLRALALLLLALILVIPQRSNLAALWPLIVLSAGLPIPELTAKAARLSLSPAAERRLHLLWWIAILSASVLWIAAHLEEIGSYRFTHIFAQLGLASGFAFLLAGRPWRVQAAVAFGLLAAYWCLFAFWPLDSVAPLHIPAGDPDTHAFQGFFAHWNKHTNAGAAIDAWFLNQLPRAEPYIYEASGLPTLDFVPTIASLIFGIMAGQLLRSGRPPVQIRNTLLVWGAGGLAAGLLGGLWVCPLVKGVWTPSWALFSTGVTVLTLVVLYEVCDIRGKRRWAFPLIVFGTNSILLYTLASNFRWWFLGVPHKLTGVDPFTGPYAPLLESLLLGLILWLIAFVLFRMKVFVRI